MVMDESILDKPVKNTSIFTAMFLILEASKIIFLKCNLYALMES